MATKMDLNVPDTNGNISKDQLEKPINTTLLDAHLVYSGHLQQRPCPDSITCPINNSQTLVMAIEMDLNVLDTFENMPQVLLEKPINTTLLDAHLVYSAHLQQRPSPDFITCHIN